MRRGRDFRAFQGCGPQLGYSCIYTPTTFCFVAGLPSFRRYPQTRIMANSAPLGSKESPENIVPVEPPFDEKLHLFWQKNSRTVYALCAVVLLAIIARGVYDFYERQREADIEASYAAANTPEKMKGFIAEHPGHTLAGVGALGLADTAYSAHDYVEAQAEYERAASALKTGPFAGRARIGAAV